MSNIKSSSTSASRRPIGTASQRQERVGSRRGVNDPSRPARRTPGGEEDDEITNYLVDVPPTVDTGARANPAPPSVAGTEHQSIVERMDWRQMKGLYDLVIKQKDEASRGTHMVIDASRFGGSDNVSDLSDNTSRETYHGRAPPPAAATGPSRRGHGGGNIPPGVAALGDAESECISSIVNISDSLSVSALEGLVSHLSQLLNVKSRESETSHMEPGPHNSSDEFNIKDRRSFSSLGNATPDRQTPQEPPQSSPYMLSQSAPSSFFAGAAPMGVTAAQNAPVGSATKRVSPHRSREGSALVVSKGVSREDLDDEDEEIKSLSSNNNEEKSGQQCSSTTPRRNMTTPSPKPRRSVTTTPTKTPPMRSGAVPPVPAYSSVDSDGGGIMTMSSAPNMCMSAKATAVTSKKRGAQSPIVISGTPVMTSAVLPVVVRKESSHNSMYSTGGEPSLSIKLPAESQVSSGHSKKHRASYDHTPGTYGTGAYGRDSRSAVVRAHHISEFHLSPNCAFDDCSVNSGSSASLLSSSVQ